MSRWISAKSIAKLLMLVPVLLLVALACGDDATPTPTATSVPPTPTTAAVAPAAAATPVPTTAAVIPTATPTPTTAPVVVEQMPEGKLVIATPDLGTESFNILSSSAIDRSWSRFILDPTVGTDIAGEVLTKTRGAAKDWDMSPDGMKWTFNFRDTIKFSNGDPLTVDDLVFTLSVALSDESRASFKTRFFPSIGGVDEWQNNVETPDPHTIIFNCIVSCPIFIWDLSDAAGLEGFIRPEKYHEEIGGADAFQNAPIGSGPYKFVSQRSGDFMEFEAIPEPHWRDGIPKFKTVLFRIIPEEATAIAALKAGEIDMASIARERVAELEPLGFNIFRQVGYSTIGYYFHENWQPEYVADGSPFTDINYRKAMNMAIDREAICESLFAGECKVAGQYWWPSIAPGFPADLEQYPFDLDECKRLLAESNYDGRKIILHSILLADVPEALRMHEAVGGMMQECGVNVSVEVTEQTKTQELRRSHKLNDQHTFFSAHNRSIGAMIALTRIIGHCDGAVTATCDPKVDQFIETMEQTLDDDLRLKTMTDYINYVHEQNYYLHIIDFSTTWATSSKVPKWDIGTKPYEQNFLGPAIGD